MQQVFAAPLLGAGGGARVRALYAKTDPASYSVAPCRSETTAPSVSKQAVETPTKVYVKVHRLDVVYDSEKFGTNCANIFADLPI